MCWSLAILFLSLTYGSVSEADHTKDHSADVVGTVYCDTCFEHDINPLTPFIPGAKVSVECKDGNFKKEVETGKHGEFKVKLPFKVWQNEKMLKECRVKLISSSFPFCSVPSVSSTSALDLIIEKQGEHIFSAGLLSFKPIEKLGFCNRKQSVPNPSEMNSLVDDYPPVFPPPPSKPVLTPGPIEHPAPPKHDSNNRLSHFLQ